MTAPPKTEAYAVAPVKFAPATDVFTWLFSSPFQTESNFAPASQRVPPVENERPIFVDELSGKHMGFLACRAVILGN